MSEEIDAILQKAKAQWVSLMVQATELNPIIFESAFDMIAALGKQAGRTELAEDIAMKAVNQWVAHREGEFK